MDFDSPSSFLKRIARFIDIILCAEWIEKIKKTNLDNDITNEEKHLIKLFEEKKSLTKQWKKEN